MEDGGRKGKMVMAGDGRGGYEKQKGYGKMRGRKLKTNFTITILILQRGR